MMGNGEKKKSGVYGSPKWYTCKLIAGIPNKKIHNLRVKAKRNI